MHTYIIEDKIILSIDGVELDNCKHEGQALLEK